MNSRRIVISDIHGCALTFRRLLHEVIDFRRDDRLFLLGDTIDRGPSSKEVIDYIVSLQEDGFQVRPLRGNHEDMFLRSCSDKNFFNLWMLNGGRATLENFGVEDSRCVPNTYRQLIAEWPFFIALPDYILVHGGLNFTAADPFADQEAMLWSRDEFVDTARIGGRKLIGGHTPVGIDDVRRSLVTDRIMLDNGCVYKGMPGLGRLVALDLDSMALHVQENIDM